MNVSARKEPLVSSYDTMHTPVINLPEVDRATFVGNVYKHVAGALAAFVAFEVLLFAAGIADSMRDFFFTGGGGRWLLLMGGVMIVQWFAANAAADLANPSEIGLATDDGSRSAEAIVELV